MNIDLIASGQRVPDSDLYKVTFSLLEDGAIGEICWESERYVDLPILEHFDISVLEVIVTKMPTPDPANGIYPSLNNWEVVCRAKLEGAKIVKTTFGNSNAKSGVTIQGKVVSLE